MESIYPAVASLPVQGAKWFQHKTYGGCPKGFLPTFRDVALPEDRGCPNMAISIRKMMICVYNYTYVMCMCIYIYVYIYNYLNPGCAFRTSSEILRLVSFQASNPTISCHAAAAARQGCEVPGALRANNGSLVFFSGDSRLGILKNNHNNHQHFMVQHHFPL